MIKTVIFDLGKVLLDFDYGIAARKLAARGTMSSEEVARFLAQSPLLFRYETGLMTTAEFSQEVSAAIGFRGNGEDFHACFADIFTEMPPMIRLHAALRQAGFPTYIFSNTNDIAVRHIRRSFPFFANFDGYILSYEQRAMKPDPAIYAAVECVTRCSGRALLYLDDRPENIETAVRRGWQTILQESPEKTLAAIDTLGLLQRGSAVA